MSIDKNKKPDAIGEDKILDSALRPQRWDDYVGQDKIKQNIKIMVEAAKKRGHTLDHLLFYGNSGLGKTTLAHLLAKEINAPIKATSGPGLESAGDLVAILTNLSEGEILFIDECHRLNKILEEYLYPAMEDYKLNIILGKGPMARTMELKVPKFTLIGATTRPAMISSPLRNRFGATFQLDFYKFEDIEKIIARSARLLGLNITPEAIKAIAQRSRFTPRVANRLLKRSRDYAEVKNNGLITENMAKEALDFLEVDELGLEPSDRRILKTIIEKFDGGPVGLQAMAAAAMEEENSILDIYEPFLMQLGLIERTPRGRTITERAYKHLGMKYAKNNTLI